MASVATAASPAAWTPPPSPDGTYLPAPVGYDAPDDGTPVADPNTTGSSSSAGGTSVRDRISGWLHDHLGTHAGLITTGAGAVVGGGLGFLTLGVPGAIGGAAAGALLGHLLVG